MAHGDVTCWKHMTSQSGDADRGRVSVPGACACPCLRCVVHGSLRTRAPSADRDGSVPGVKVWRASVLLRARGGRGRGAMHGMTT